MLSVVLPFRNEEASIRRYASELFPALDALGEPWELVAVDDGSSDAGAAVLLGLSRGRAVRVLSHGRGRGLGAALRTGFSDARGEWVATLDADLSFDPRALKELLETQRRTEADLVSGSPYLRPGAAAAVPWRRRLPSLMLNAFYRGLFGRALTAYTPILRLYRRSALRETPLSSEGFEINAEVAARFLAAGRRVAEVPADLGERREGSSKLSAARELARHARLILRLLSGR